MEHLVHLIDLSFLPDEFFDLRSHPEVGAIYNDMVGNPQSPGVGDFNNRSLNWTPAPRDGDSFQFPGTEENTKFFVKVIDNFLELFYGKTDGNIDTWREWALGFLSTAINNPQEPHVDYKQDAMQVYVNKGDKSKNSRGEFVLPCSFDLPLTDGGMRFSIYGLDGPDSMRECLRTIPLDVEVPAKHMLLWR